MVSVTAVTVTRRCPSKKARRILQLGVSFISARLTVTLPVTALLKAERPLFGIAQPPLSRLPVAPDTPSLATVLAS